MLFIPQYYTDGCTDGFEDWNGKSDYCYTSMSDKKTFYDAQDVCSTLGDELAVIHSEDIMTSIWQHTHEAGEQIWIGLKKDQLEDGKNNH